MKKAVSPLIAYIMLIGMVVAMSAIVGNYLINQARNINFESKENEIYCADVAIDAIVQKCVLQTRILSLNITNRGSYSISSLSIIRKDSATTNLVIGEEFNYNLYNNLQVEDTTKPLFPILPGKKALLKLIINPSSETKITITPSIRINDKSTICNEKLFKLEFDTSECINEV